MKAKKVIIIGDQDSVPGPAIWSVVKSAGAGVVVLSRQPNVLFELQQKGRWTWKTNRGLRMRPAKPGPEERNRNFRSMRGRMGGDWASRDGGLHQETPPMQVHW